MVFTGCCIAICLEALQSLPKNNFGKSMVTLMNIGDGEEKMTTHTRGMLYQEQCVLNLSPHACGSS